MILSAPWGVQKQCERVVPAHTVPPPSFVIVSRPRIVPSIPQMLHPLIVLLLAATTIPSVLYKRSKTDTAVFGLITFTPCKEVSVTRPTATIGGETLILIQLLQ